MDRFMDSADPTKRTRSKEVQNELSSCRERLRLLTSDGVGGEYLSCNVPGLTLSLARPLRLRFSCNCKLFAQKAIAHFAR
jgi:hypothetical protein